MQVITLWGKLEADGKLANVASDHLQGRIGREEKRISRDLTAQLSPVAQGQAYLNMYGIVFIKE